MGVGKVFSPIESAVKGVTSRVTDPLSIIQDAGTIISKPSSLVDKSFIEGNKDKKDAANAESGRRAWYGAYGDAVAFRNKVDDSNSINTAGTSNVGLVV